jgi:5'-nucleotidase
MINRRKFLASSITCGSAFVVSRVVGNSFAESIVSSGEGIKITILHTNDTHSQIDPLPTNDKYAGKGGVARRATLVRKIRSENPNTLLIDAGDVCQGTPYFNFFKGEVEYKAMSMIGYDAGTLGNHEFDNGVASLASALKFANFDIVSANYEVKGTPLETIVKPYVVKTVSGIRVGLFGLGISPVSLIDPANFKGVTYLDPITTAREVVNTLREKEKCALVVCMSHLGYSEHPRHGAVIDTTVASQVDGIDFIASGHTHLFMEKPVMQQQPCGKETVIFQVGKSGIYVGRVDFTFRDGKVAKVEGKLIDLRET